MKKAKEAGCFVVSTEVRSFFRNKDFQTDNRSGPMCFFGSKRGRYSTHTCNTEGFTYEHSLTLCLLRFTGNKKRRKELVSSINGRFLLRMEKISDWRAQRIAHDEELREVDASGGSAKSSQKKGKKARVTMASERSLKR